MSLKRFWSRLKNEIPQNMDITIEPIFCGNKNCIGLKGFNFVVKPQPIIVIEDVWDCPQKIIEKAIVGMISHETIEYLIAETEVEAGDIWDVHDLIGKGQRVRDYIDNLDGLVFLCKPQK